MLPIHKKPVCFPRALGNCTDVSMRIDDKTCHDESKNFATDTSDEETCHDLEQHVYRGFETKLDGTGKLLVYFPYVETLQNEADKRDQDTRNFELTEARIDVLLGKDETIDLRKLISHSDLQNRIATVAAKNNALTSVKRDIVRKDPEIYDDSGEIIEDDWNNLPLAPETLRQEVVDKYKNEIENYTYNYLQWSNPLLKYQYEIRRYEHATSKRVKDLGDGDLDDREAFSQIHYDKGYFPLSNHIVPADETTPTILNEVIMIKEVNGIPDLRHGQGISAPFGLDEYCMGLVDNLSLAEAPQTCNSDESCTWHFQSKIGDLDTTHSPSTHW